MPKTNLTTKPLPCVCRKGPGGAPTIHLATYRQRLRARIDAYLALMAQHWGCRPDLQITLTTDVVVRADFTLKGFAHQGRRIQVKTEHAEGRHSPEKVARQIVEELVVHRNTCDRCGEGIPTLRQRADYGTNSYAGRNPRVWYTDATGQMRSRPARVDELTLFDLPPDPVERALLPGLARRLDKRLQVQAEAAAAQEEVKAKEPEYVNVAVGSEIQTGTSSPSGASRMDSSWPESSRSCGSRKAGSLRTSSWSSTTAPSGTRSSWLSWQPATPTQQATKATLLT